MNVLLTNDDGIEAEGLKALCRAFAVEHDVVVIAPEVEQSAVGHGISLRRPIRVTCRGNQGSVKWFAVSGTPADCVKLGVLELLEERPDLVVSGINAGLNHGFYINYSGTVAAAREGSVYGIPSIAVSMEGRSPANFDDGAAFTAELAVMIADMPIPPNTFLNINMPDLPRQKISFVRFCSQDMLLPEDGVDAQTDGDGSITCRYVYEGTQRSMGNDTDRAVLSRNGIAITPVTCNTTCNESLQRLKDFKLSI